MVKFNRKEIASRKNLVFYAARFFLGWGTKHLAKPYIEVHENIKKLKKENSVFLYAGLHKSLWEASGIILSLHIKKLPMPYPGMGDNLVKGKFFQSMSKKMGLFFIKRAKTRREIIESARMLKDYILNLIAHGIDGLVYPEGTRTNIPTKGRYGDFFPTAFEALLEYEKNKEEILSRNSNLKSFNSYIVPFNLDYSWVREDSELIKETGGKPRTLHILDSLKMIKHVGPVCISFGKPVKIAENLDKSRRELAMYTREKCLELVKILPINILCRSILDSYENGSIKVKEILKNIRPNIEKLIHLKGRFREFSAEEDPGNILEKVTKRDKRFKKIDVKDLKLYRLYANYINHYFEGD